MQSTFVAEIVGHKRFKFSKNWALFLGILNTERIDLAKTSFQSMLDMDTLVGKDLIDVGSRSGSFSLAARQPAGGVHSFDYHPDSVACTQVLRDLFFKNDPDWIINEGSVLGASYLKSLGRSGHSVFPWCVASHRGHMACNRYCGQYSAVGWKIVYFDL
jgi:hypothetical protein